MCGCLSSAPHLGHDLAHTPGKRLDWELNRILFFSQASAQSTGPHPLGHTSQGGKWFLSLPDEPEGPLKGNRNQLRVVSRGSGTKDTGLFRAQRPRRRQALTQADLGAVTLRGRPWGPFPGGRSRLCRRR